MILHGGGLWIIHRRFQLLFLIWFSSTASVVYDPANPPRQENWEPSEANPRENATCLGASSSLQLRPWHEINLNSLSMQRLCAKTQYGGRPLGENFGAYCVDDEVECLLLTAFDDSSPRTSANLHETQPPDAWARLLLECRTRCFCNFGLQDPRQKPKRATYHDRTVLTNFMDIYHDNRRGLTLDSPTLEIQLAPRVPDFTTSIHLRSQLATQLRIRPPRDKDSWVFDLSTGIHPANYIECDGDLPRFTLPPPFSQADFEDNAELCAVPLAGGNEYVPEFSR